MLNILTVPASTIAGTCRAVKLALRGAATRYPVDRSAEQPAPEFDDAVVGPEEEMW